MGARKKNKPKPPEEITREEWEAEVERVDLEALDKAVRATVPGDPGLTVTEMATRYKCCKESMRKRIKNLLAAKQLIEGRAMRTDSMGRVSSALVYRPPDKKGK